MATFTCSSETSRGGPQRPVTVHRLLALLAVVALAGCIETNGSATRRSEDSCRPAGCSAQVCSDRDDVVTTCEWRSVYECYQSATCERQSDGACGWTPTEELNACLARHSP